MQNIFLFMQILFLLLHIWRRHEKIASQKLYTSTNTIYEYIIKKLRELMAIYKTLNSFATRSSLVGAPVRGTPEYGYLEYGYLGDPVGGLAKATAKMAKMIEKIEIKFILNFFFLFLWKSLDLIRYSRFTPNCFFSWWHTTFIPKICIQLCISQRAHQLIFGLYTFM